MAWLVTLRGIPKPAIWSIGRLTPPATYTLAGLGAGYIIGYTAFIDDVVTILLCEHGGSYNEQQKGENLAHPCGAIGHHVLVHQG